VPEDGSALAQGFEVGGRAVTLVRRKPVARESGVPHRSHEPVTCDLGDDGSGRDASASCVTLDHRCLREGYAGQFQRIYQQVIGSRFKQVYSPAHRYSRGGDYPKPVYLRRIRCAARVTDGVLFYIDRGSITLVRRELLAVTYQLKTVFRQHWRKNHGTSHHRSGKCASTDLIDTGRSVVTLLP